MTLPHSSARLLGTALSPRFPYSLAIALACAATPGFAQESSVSEPQPRTPIVVTGQGLSDTPATPAYDVELLDRDALERTSSGRIEEVLASIAGFQQFRRADSRASNPSNQGATLRALGGNASSRALMLLDGVPVANPFFGYIPFSALSPERIGEVRVTRGGGMGAFGTGAVSGTIELTSATPQEIGTLQALALVDQRGETQGSLTVAPTLGDGFVVAGVQWDRGKGFWTTPAAQRVKATARAAYDSWSGSIRAVAPLGATMEVQASALAYDDARTLRFKGADSTSSGQQASLRVVGRGEWQFDVLGYLQAQDFSNIVISSTNYRKTLDQKKTPTLSVGGKLEVRPPVGPDHVLRLGADIRYARGNLVEMPYSTVTGLATAVRHAGGRQTDLGLYAESDWTLGDVTLTGGLRADRWTIGQGYFRERNTAGVLTKDQHFADRNGWDLNARSGLVWRASPAVSLRAAAYTGLRLPTLNELYRPFVVFPVSTEANAALKPEKLRGAEAGIDFHPTSAIDLALTVFENRLKDAVANVTVAPNTRQRQNVNAIRARGIEASAQARMGSLSLAAALSWTDSKVEAAGTQSALDGLRPAQVPRLATSATLAWTPRERWRATATVRHTGAQYEDDRQKDRLPAATTLDLAGEIPIAGPVSLVVRAENVTDETVVTRYQPEQVGSIDLGTPRTLWAGIRVGLR